MVYSIKNLQIFTDSVRLYRLYGDNVESNIYKGTHLLNDTSPVEYVNSRVFLYFVKIIWYYEIKDV